LCNKQLTEEEFFQDFCATAKSGFKALPSTNGWRQQRVRRQIRARIAAHQQAYPDFFVAYGASGRSGLACRVSADGADAVMVERYVDGRPGRVRVSFQAPSTCARAGIIHKTVIALGINDA